MLALFKIFLLTAFVNVLQLQGLKTDAQFCKICNTAKQYLNYKIFLILLVMYTRIITYISLLQTIVINNPAWTVPVRLGTLIFLHIFTWKDINFNCINVVSITCILPVLEMF